MTDLPYFHVDAFADRPFTGNQAAVMPLGYGIMHEQVKPLLWKLAHPTIQTIILP